MKKLTKKQRHKDYKYALKNWKGYFFLSLKKNGLADVTQYDEIMLFTHNTLEGYDKELILMFCIEMTK